MNNAGERAGPLATAYRDTLPTCISLMRLALLLFATPATAAGPAINPPDTKSFCARMTLQPDGETLRLSSPVTFNGKVFKHEIRAGMNADRGRSADVFGEILNLCGDRIARPPMPHE